MPSEPNIGSREREILTAIVETFISTGEPVGSRTLARSNREGLSPASIRNVMADLSDAGIWASRTLRRGGFRRPRLIVITWSRFRGRRGWRRRKRR